MATVDGYLNGRSTFYTPNETIRASARARGTRIEKRLEDDYVADLFETGSLTHGTGIWYHSDVDYFVKFYGVIPTPQTALNRIKSSMQSLYPTTDIAISRPAVKLDFTQQVKVELVPAYGTDEEHVYWIPDPTDVSKWMKSAPRKHLDYVNSAQQKRDNTKKAIRLLKVWKAIRSVPVSSFYLEMRMAKFMKTSTSQVSTSDAVATVIFDLYKIGFAAMQDPTTSSSKMFSACSTDVNKSTATSKALTAAGCALPARVLELEGKHDEAIAQWKKVLEY